jgi:hypothetical protein
MTGILTTIIICIFQLHLTLVQKGALHSGIKIYNQLPTHIKYLSKDPKNFKLKLKSFFLEQTLYSLEEFY